MMVNYFDTIWSKSNKTESCLFPGCEDETIRSNSYCTACKEAVGVSNSSFGVDI